MVFLELESQWHVDQERLILSNYTTFHFHYCPIIWMLNSCKLTERINDSLSKTLRTVNKGYCLSFQNLFIKKKIHTLPKEITNTCN